MLFLCALGAGLASCKTPKKQALVASPTPIPRVTVAVHGDGQLSKSKDGRTVYDDRTRDLVLEVPAGWIGTTDFTAGEDGPPPAGELRLRTRLGPDPFCLIDLAFEPLPASEDALKTSVARGRELFFFAQTDEPASRLPGALQWASTAVPVTPGRTDVGYWIETSGHLVRLEGRFPNDRVPECKEALDAMVTSMTTREAGGAAARREPDVNPG